jgi:hypothetical protein
MNDLLKQIRDMLRVEDAKIFSSAQSSHILIEESDNNQKENTLRKVTISVGEEFRNWFAFSPDGFLNGKNKDKKQHSLFPLLNDAEDYQKTCDCVVVMLDKNNNLRLILIEMKTSLKQTKKIARIQLTNAHKFFLCALDLKLKHLKLSLEFVGNGDEKNKLKKLKEGFQKFRNAKYDFVILTSDKIGTRKGINRNGIYDHNFDQSGFRTIFNIKNEDERSLNYLINKNI